MIRYTSIIKYIKSARGSITWKPSAMFVYLNIAWSIRSPLTDIQLAFSGVRHIFAEQGPQLWRRKPYYIIILNLEFPGHLVLILNSLAQSVILLCKVGNYLVFLLLVQYCLDCRVVYKSDHGGCACVCDPFKLYKKLVSYKMKVLFERERLN